MKSSFELHFLPKEAKQTVNNQTSSPSNSPLFLPLPTKQGKLDYLLAI